ncbi:MAG: beta-galactosidase [bacterium]
MRTKFYLISLLIFSSCFLGLAFTYREDFTLYKEGSDGSPNWYTSSVNWRVEKGVMINDDTSKSNLILEKSPYGRVLTLSATVTVREKKVADWKIAGITVYIDSGHFWHLALVEAPEAMGSRHFAELAQMLNGEWNTQGKLKMTEDKGFENFPWQYNKPYRLMIKLTENNIEGLIYDTEGNLLAKRAYALEPDKSVMFGKVGLTNSGFLTAFDDVEVDILKEEKYTPPKPVYPPYKGKGWNGIKAKAKGFFYTKEINGIWWLIDPLGNAFYSVGTDHCNYNVHWAEKLGYAPYHRFVEGKYGSEDKWGDSAVKRLLSWGFTSLGANSSPGVRYKGLAHTEFAGLGASFARLDYITKPINWTGFPNVFSPKFEDYCKKQARERCSPHKDDPWLIGYFIDNELEWFGKSGREWGLVDDIFRLPQGNSAKKALLKFLQEKYKNNIQAFNKAWGLNLSDFADIEKLVEPPQTNSEQAIKDKLQFVGIIADRYFEITTKAIKEADPNHLVLGCRFAWTAPDPAWISCGKYCDVISVNMYPWVDLKKEKVRDVEEMLRKRYQQAHKPFMLTEWSFPALDSGLPCTHGAGERFANQEERAKAYSIFQNLLFRLPFMVGSHYFMWVDEPKEGISTSFPENTNYGLVNVRDEPYPLLVGAASKLNPLVYQIHSGKIPQPKVEIKEGKIVLLNEGQAGEVEVAISVNGKKIEKKVSLHRQIELAYELPSSPGAYLVDVEVKWGGLKIAEGRDVFYRKVDSWYEGRRRFPLIIINEGEEEGRDVPIAIPTDKLPMKLGEGESLIIRDVEGNILPSQFDGVAGEISFNLKEIKPLSALLLYLYPSHSVPQRGEEIKVTQEGNKFEIDNGELKLVKDKEDGDLIDAIYLNGVMLGRYQALIREDLSQRIWVAPNRVEKVEVREASSRVIVDIVARFDGAEAITEVGGGGQFAPQRVIPLSYRVGYRLIIYPKVQWFIGKFLWVENTSGKIFPLGAYYHYLPSEIGGEAGDDEPNGAPRRYCYIHEKEEVVPSYYDSAPGAAWQDKGLSAWFGAMPIWGSDFHFIFWKDEGGREHPDIWKEVGKTLSPGETYEDDEGEIIVFGALGKNSYERLVQAVKGWQDIRWEIREEENR